MSSTVSRRYARSMKRLQESDPDTAKAVRDHVSRIKSEARYYRLQVPTSPSQSKEALDEEPAVETDATSDTTRHGENQ